MTLNESVEYHCNELMNETVDYEDALEYIEDVIADISEEHPDVSTSDIEDLVKKELDELYNGD